MLLLHCYMTQKQMFFDKTHLKAQVKKVEKHYSASKGQDRHAQGLSLSFDASMKLSLA